MGHVGLYRLVCLSAWFILKAAAESMVITPSKLVVKYGDAASATCSTTEQKHGGMGWEASEGGVDIVEGVQQVTWAVPNITHWDLKPICYMISENVEQLVKELNIVIYKLPDSIDVKKCSEPLNEGETCTLQCDIKSVAPVKNLQVMWYKQQVVLENVTFNENTMSPVEKHLNRSIQASRNDDGAEYWCEAKLELGPEGPQPPPTKKSEPRRITVHYKPRFANDTETIEAGNTTLNCTVKANPPPVYTWEAPHLDETFYGPTLSVTYPGNYKCTASNQRGNATKLFIVKPYPNTVFLVCLLIGIFVALVLIAAVIFTHWKRKQGRAANNSIPSPADQKEEDVELVKK
ncbi:intercellular adhesion molecule 5-like [Silurus meridionalis]|uniref:intercellular adhesion molecule 5-like n=1 Tax=Silurus meridionalis TaxID=175797 RepID=UPI001EEC1D63|nr:intercellular adhesion molecule 5-like [Silurus meridionalis]KAI5091554.1 vascular cell adhesion protein 1 [Silurus meridionalis]